MFYFFNLILEIAIFVTSIYLIVSGISKNEKYSSPQFIRKRNLIFGIVLLLIFIIAGLPEMYQGFIDGGNARIK